jgi:hypothetical protein
MQGFFTSSFLLLGGGELVLKSREGVSLIASIAEGRACINVMGYWSIDSVGEGVGLCIEPLSELDGIFGALVN